MKTIRFAVSNWPGHLPGQHADVRLTAEDGYRAERSYSIASPPEASGLELTVDRLDDGEVSPFLTGQLHPGDTIELRGPIGGYFVWSALRTAAATAADRRRERRGPAHVHAAAPAIVRQRRAGRAPVLGRRTREDVDLPRAS